jgi:hypothetical protein
MIWAHWLQGGPFLEVSFILELKEGEKQTVKSIINKLTKCTNTKIEFIDKNIDEIIDFFQTGYPYDEVDPHTIYLHSLSLRLFVHLSKKRKATLQIEKVSSNSLLVNFWFFGSQFDAPEWEQIGVKEEEILDFTNFLTELYIIFEYKIGGVAIEEDILSLFSCNEMYPNEFFRFENLTPEKFLREQQSYFTNILWNEKYKILNNIPFQNKRIEKNGLLITIPNSNSWDF